MKEIMLAVDVLLAALIGPSPNFVDALINQARNGDANFLVGHHALFCALYSVKESDFINVRRLAELVKYSQIQPEEPEYLGSQERERWIPSEAEMTNWRGIATKP